MPDQAALRLTTPVEDMQQVGAKRAQLLQKLGIRTVQDLLFWFPRDYQDLSQLTPLAELEDGTLARTTAIVAAVEVRTLGPRRSIVQVLVEHEAVQLRCVWFNQPFLANRFQDGDRVAITGTPKLKQFHWEMHHPQVELLEPEQEAACGLVPVYPTTQGVSQFHFRNFVQLAVEQCAEQLVDVFPSQLQHDCQVLPLAEALRALHRPENAEQLSEARYRFAFQELFTMQLALALRHASVSQSKSVPLPCDAVLDARIRRLLPFSLTTGQETVIEEILNDIARPRAMNRMLQGDVGSGKTLVAAFAVLVAVANQGQAAIMAPTEILARQHFDTFQSLLGQSRVRIALLTGSLTAAQRRELGRQLSTGEIDLVIGTQALIQADVRFSHLTLAVIDEGHRFGVEQRARLRQQEVEPHYLVMTATPIPRTISMTLFGDLEISELRDRPVGRQAVHTYVGAAERRASWWEFVRKKLREGRQAYVIAPLVDEQETGDVASVETVFEQLCHGELSDFRVGLLHGRMSAAEKIDAMEAFRGGSTQVLVATSLIEVGLDVPNASVMTIENAERFGLAQLHQLRGRVGRGAHPGFVCVFSPQTEGNDRLEAFSTTHDGFELAELDFRQRGPGDLFGREQHGMPKLRVADLARDGEILERARDAARALVATDPDLSAADLGELRRRVLLRYGESLNLGDVG